MSGVICLSTPFLYAVPRDLILWNNVRLALCLLTAQVFVWWTVYGTGKYFMAHSGATSSTLSLGLAIGSILTFAAVYGTFLLLSGWKDWSEGECDKFRMPDSLGNKLLVIRMSGDEAASALSTAYFIGWIFSYLFALSSRLTVRFKALLDHTRLHFSVTHSWIEDLSEKLFAIKVGVGWIYLFLMAWAVNLVLMGVDLFYVLLAVFIVSLPLLVLAVIFGSDLLASFVSAAFFVGIILPTAVAISPFGLSLALTGPFIEINTESIPRDDSCETVSFVPISRDLLAHFAPYDDERVLAKIVQWINARCEQGSLQSDE
jgi:hypothetical protein